VASTSSCSMFVSEPTCRTTVAPGPGSIFKSCVDSSAWGSFSRK
jgi:hypothetical protein